MRNMTIIASLDLLISGFVPSIFLFPFYGRKSQCLSQASVPSRRSFLWGAVG
jgi:hypothetical protein